MQLRKADKDIDKLKEKKEEKESSNTNLFVFTVVIIIIITFIFTSGSLKGMVNTLGDLGKEKIKNEDGTFSIPEDAQTLENNETSREEAMEKYIGKVDGEKIQLFRDDNFNKNIQDVINFDGLTDYQKIQWIRVMFDQQIDAMIGMTNAKKLGINISKDYLIKEVGARSNKYRDKDGDVDIYLMKKDEKEVNRQAEMLLDQLLYENFKRDLFEGLPISFNELYDNYKLDNIKITLEYMDILNNEINKDILKKYYDNNKEKYRLYKLIRLYFKTKEIAAENLNKFRQEPLKFIEFAEKLKAEDKIVNIRFDPEYYFIEEFTEPQLGEIVKKTGKDQVGEKVIESELGNFIFLVENIVYGEIEDGKTSEKVKNDYLAENNETVNKSNKEKSDLIYEYALKNDLLSASKKYGSELKKSSPFLFMGYNAPNMNPDETDDLNFMVQVFKGSKGEILKPHKHKNGYMIARIIEKEDVTKEKVEGLYNDLVSRYSNRKSQNLENDYYSVERKKIQIIDNFKYVNFQLLMPKKEESQ